MSLSRPAALTVPVEAALEPDLQVLADRLSDLINAFAWHHPNFELTELGCDYVEHSDPARLEYMVILSLRI